MSCNEAKFVALYLQYLPHTVFSFGLAQSLPWHNALRKGLIFFAAEQQKITNGSLVVVATDPMGMTT